MKSEKALGQVPAQTSHVFEHKHMCQGAGTMTNHTAHFTSWLVLTSRRKSGEHQKCVTMLQTLRRKFSAIEINFNDFMDWTNISMLYVDVVECHCLFP
ncbi:hypothetical protein RB195_000924 [Necator americanus]|uniref:Uncharacterized protein n=1 Tax=Necator americanus TaxID=51031 RepID=A0ABR1DBX2_NECAM